MPLQLSVGISRKLGLPGYSSVGASCHLELELDAGLLVKHPGNFQQQVAEAYQACSQAVQAELARQRVPQAASREVVSPGSPHGPLPDEQRDLCQPQSRAADHGRPRLTDSTAAGALDAAGADLKSRAAGPTSSGAASPSPGPNGRLSGAPPANGGGQSSDPPAATPRQHNFLHQLVAQIRGLSIPRLEELSRQRFGKPLGRLASSEASQLIDLLKDIRGGQLVLDEVFAGEGAVT